MKLRLIAACLLGIVLPGPLVAQFPSPSAGIPGPAGAANSGWYQNSAVGFGSGHPSASYGDQTGNPGIIDTQRRLARCDEILGSLGSGSGTRANLFTKLSGRWNSTNGNYTTTAVWNCMAAPLYSQNPVTATAGAGGTFLGPFGFKPMIGVQ